MATQIQLERPVVEHVHDERLRIVEEDFDRIRCRDCGRSYPALDGPALLYSLKASCPHCGGGFEMAL
jgi:Zn finger protein HypA/HybF involved in hydrogenase expression